VPLVPLAHCAGSYFHILAIQSPDPLARYVPLLARSIEITEFLWPWSMNWAWPVTMFQNWMERSFEPDTTHWPSGEMATERT
jgi:hypothetical protein